MLIDGQTVAVTGGGSGLGAATARHFANLGARTAILDFDAARGQAVADEIGGMFVQTDVSSAAAAGAAMDQITAALGPPRVVVNCAGIGLAARILGREGKLSFDVFEKTIAVNLFGTYHIMSHAARVMAGLEVIDGERGVIINTSSIAFEDGQLGQAAYAASKGAISSMSLPAAREFAKLAIRVVAIAPGLFNTPMMAGLPKEVTDAITANIPHPARLGSPEDYALMAAQIVANPYLNGTAIRLDGAVRLPPR